ncbi:MAG: hypothetical protein HC838_17875 [Spirulinaceae cyanobacterium RM2_2_10]|nr:hypothetical protein [Spirulinaceae cyanobacterium SM2_1_0]NJO21530.1 hypothetical protein [Spirulinaceae cyanobacterium RM2_2_10]
MSVHEAQWSSQEREAARSALTVARQRETETLVKTIRRQAGNIDNINDAWCLHDFLSAQRHYIDGKYDDRESGLLFVLSELIKEGWLTLDELKRLDAAKLVKISALARMC